MAIELNAFKLKIYEFVESRMTFIAPNLSLIIGASTAAKLIGRWCKSISIQFFNANGDEVRAKIEHFRYCRRTDKFGKDTGL